MTHTPGDGLKAADLMIGNYVLVPKSDEFDLRICKLFEIRKKQFRVIEVSTNMMFDQTRVEPIPLTEDWLKRFGFEIQTNQVSIVADTYAKGKFWLFCDHETKKFEVVVLGTLINFQHVHQLQNLYYCLTGTQLTLTDFKPTNHDK